MSPPAPMLLQWLFLASTMIQLVNIAAEFFKPFNVSYDHRALLIDGKRRMLISAGIHYPRATPEMWPDLISKSKEGGADVVQTYVFWNAHEPVKGQHNFEGRYNLVKFVKLVASSGLYLHLRIGPYVCAEWNFGGFPVWLRDIPGIEFRTNNEQFKEEMEQFVRRIVDMMREEMLFSWQGGPIILLQIENEYGNVERSYGRGGKDYVEWAARMAVGLDVGVPWVMCKQVDAPAFIINACNGYYCDGFRPNSYKKPIFWTEDWDGWYTSWGQSLPHRPVEDLAFAVARFFQRGGCFQNYYMYFGGTNFGRTSGGPFYITSYDYDAPIDEYGLLSQPKWGHLKDLHAAIKLCEPALVAIDSPQYVKLGPMQEAHVYHKKDNHKRMDLKLNQSEDESICSAFLANIDQHNAVSVKFRGQLYTLPPWSVSILPDCINVAFNTAKVGSQTNIKSLEFNLPGTIDIMSSRKLILHNRVSYVSKSWMTVKEPVSVWSQHNFTLRGILEHLNVTKDSSDYLWYFTRIFIASDDMLYWKKNGITPSLKIDKMRDAVYILINGQLTGSAVGHWVKVVQPIQLLPGYNDLTLLSLTVGLQNYGAFFEKDGAGFRGHMTLSGLSSGDIDLTELTWTYQVGLKGEFEKIYSVEGSERVSWANLAPDGVLSTLSWYKTYFDAPEGSDPVAVNLRSMGKGQAWVNGHHIGRYWIWNAPKDGCQEICDYRGPYNSKKCRTNCGEPTQIWYHIPRSWLQGSNNLLVLFEEIGGNPFAVEVKSHSVQTICAQVSESHYPPISKWSHADTHGKVSINDTIPEMHLQCQNGYLISVQFASYGNPQGSCQHYSEGSCHAPNSFGVVSGACQGRENCNIEVSSARFGNDPCRGTVKMLAVEARCTFPEFMGAYAM